MSSTTNHAQRKPATTTKIVEIAMSQDQEDEQMMDYSSSSSHNHTTATTTATPTPTPTPAKKTINPTPAIPSVPRVPGTGKHAAAKKGGDAAAGGVSAAAGGMFKGGVTGAIQKKADAKKLAAKKAKKQQNFLALVQQNDEAKDRETRKNEALAASILATMAAASSAAVMGPKPIHDIPLYGDEEVEEKEVAKKEVKVKTEVINLASDDDEEEEVKVVASKKRKHNNHGVPRISKEVKKAILAGAKVDKRVVDTAGKSAEKQMRDTCKAVYAYIQEHFHAFEDIDMEHENIGYAGVGFFASATGMQMQKDLILAIWKVLKGLMPSLVGGAASKEAIIQLLVEQYEKLQETYPCLEIINMKYVEATQGFANGFIQNNGQATPTALTRGYIMRMVVEGLFNNTKPDDQPIGQLKHHLTQEMWTGPFEEVMKVYTIREALRKKKHNAQHKSNKKATAARNGGGEEEGEQVRAVTDEAFEALSVQNRIVKEENTELLAKVERLQQETIAAVNKTAKIQGKSDRVCTAANEQAQRLSGEINTLRMQLAAKVEEVDEVEEESREKDSRIERLENEVKRLVKRLEAKNTEITTLMIENAGFRNLPEGDMVAAPPPVVSRKNSKKEEDSQEKKDAQEKEIVASSIAGEEDQEMEDAPVDSQNTEDNYRGKETQPYVPLDHKEEESDSEEEGSDEEQEDKGDSKEEDEGSDEEASQGSNSQDEETSEGEDDNGEEESDGNSD